MDKRCSICEMCVSEQSLIQGVCEQCDNDPVKQNFSLGSCSNDEHIQKFSSMTSESKNIIPKTEGNEALAQREALTDLRKRQINSGHVSDASDTSLDSTSSFSEEDNCITPSLADVHRQYGPLLKLRQIHERLN